MRKLNKEELVKLRFLVDEVVDSMTKKEAQPLIRKLEFYAETLKLKLVPSSAHKLSEIVIYAKSSAGQAQNRQHWLNCLQQCWYVFETDHE